MEIIPNVYGGNGRCLDNGVTELICGIVGMDKCIHCVKSNKTILICIDQYSAKLWFYILSRWHRFSIYNMFLFQLIMKWYIASLPLRQQKWLICLHNNWLHHVQIMLVIYSYTVQDFQYSSSSFRRPRQAWGIRKQNKIKNIVAKWSKCDTALCIDRYFFDINNKK